MQQLLKSDTTAAQRRIPIHLVDATDGITPEPGEATGQPQIAKNGGAFANTTNTLVAIGNGAYYVELTATEIDTLGFIVVRYKSAATAEAQVSAQVVAFNPFDSMRLGLDALPDAAVQAAGGLYTRGTGAGQINQQTNGQIDVNVDAWDNNSSAPKVGATSGIPTVDVTAWQDFVMPGASMVENDGAGAARYTTKALEQAPSGGGGGLTQQDVADALKLAPSAGAPAVGSVNHALPLGNAPATQDGLPTLTASGVVKSDVNEVAGSGVAGVDDFRADVSALALEATLTARTPAPANATKLDKSTSTIVEGAAVAGVLTTTQMSTNLTEATDDHYKGRIIIWSSGALKDQATDITGYNGTTKVLTFTAVTGPPSAADEFIIV